VTSTRLAARELVLNAHAALGEGPVWDARSGSLLWVDIRHGEVHWFDPGKGTDTTLSIGQDVGAVAPTDGELVVVAARDGFGVADRSLGTFTLIAPVEIQAIGNRMNDGKCDRLGRFWAGTLAMDHESAAGALYRLELDGSVTRVLEGVGISNGLAWSTDDRTLYYIDSAKGTVDAFDYESETGACTRRRELVTIPASQGVPDGMAIDVEGYLWVAIFGGSCLRRYSADGRLEREVRLPVSLVTSCAFGGTDLADLYVTSARVDGNRVIEDEPYAGGLFCFRPGVVGLPANLYGGCLQ
jgi:sugar lactone lactonase YvrE